MANCCALTCIYLRPPSDQQPPMADGNTRAASMSRRWNQPRRRIKLLLVCTSRSRGRCVYPGACSYRHACATCHQHHVARDCVDTPDTVEHKKVACNLGHGQSSITQSQSHYWVPSSMLRQTTDTLANCSNILFPPQLQVVLYVPSIMIDEYCWSRLSPSHHCVY